MSVWVHEASTRMAVPYRQSVVETGDTDPEAPRTAILLSPDVFLPLAEQAGLMRRLALRVLERSLRDLQDVALPG